MKKHHVGVIVFTTGLFMFMISLLTLMFIPNVWLVVTLFSGLIEMVIGEVFLMYDDFKRWFA